MTAADSVVLADKLSVADPRRAELGKWLMWLGLGVALLGGVGWMTCIMIAIFTARVLPEEIAILTAAWLTAVTAIARRAILQGEMMTRPLWFELQSQQQRYLSRLLDFLLAKLLDLPGGKMPESAAHQQAADPVTSSANDSGPAGGKT